MGCDIHMVLEKRNGSGWVGVQTFNALPRKCFDLPPGNQGLNWIWWGVTHRNYETFNALAGVRGEGSPLGYTPRGVPDDVSELAQMEIDHWNGDGHTHSWLSIVEAIPAFDQEHSETMSNHLVNGVELVKYANEAFGIEEDTLDALDQYRIVFWFDN